MKIQTLVGSFSAVSKPICAGEHSLKYSLELVRKLLTRSTRSTRFYSFGITTPCLYGAKRKVEKSRLQENIEPHLQYGEKKSRNGKKTTSIRNVLFSECLSVRKTESKTTWRTCIHFVRRNKGRWPKDCSANKKSRLKNTLLSGWRPFLRASWGKRAPSERPVPSVRLSRLLPVAVNLGNLYTETGQTSQGSFSAVSKTIFGSQIPVGVTKQRQKTTKESKCWVFLYFRHFGVFNMFNCFFVQWEIKQEKATDAAASREDVDAPAGKRRQEKWVKTSWCTEHRNS